MRAFVDTGAWYALLNGLDIYHPRASAFMQKPIGREARLFTSDYVIDETTIRISPSPIAPASPSCDN